ncbi:MAG TPA: peptidylprolyl isomerase [Ilumatobacteraceae bacterium]|nr:peptidylprolyl isomerase [Ilumatobacteraceae bacterium]
MNRRAVVIPVVLLAGAVTGCATFSDNDAAARVGDFELSQDELGDLVIGATPTTTTQPGTPAVDESGASADTARNVLNIWILTKIVEADLTARGESVTSQKIADVTGALAAQDPQGWAAVPIDLQNLQVMQRAAVETWSALEFPPPSDDELRTLYDSGTAKSGIVCTAHILVAAEADAKEILDRLEGGADFAELATSESTDTASAANGGNLPCALTNTFEDTYVPEFVEGVLAAQIGEPFGPVQSEFGYHVIVLRPSERIDPAELATLYTDTSARFQRAAAEFDVYVDPRYGSFNPVTGVEALG